MRFDEHSMGLKEISGAFHLVSGVIQGDPGAFHGVLETFQGEGCSVGFS